MKRRIVIPAVIALAASLAFAAPASAHTKHVKQKRVHDTIWVGHYGRIHNWQAVNRSQLIVWATPSRPYLVTLRRPVRGLRHTYRIGFTTRHGRINRFDSIYVDGWREPIRSIVALDRRTARLILRH